MRIPLKPIPRARHLRRLRLLGLQRLSDEQRTSPSCVLVQIDGLAYKHFRRALQTGKLPYLAKLLRQGRAVAGPWHSMLPTSTSAFQSGLFYGNNDEIPGFYWIDKQTGREVRMNTTEDTSRVEDEIRGRVAPYPGLLTGGSSYSALFTGGAENTFLTFARLFSPTYNMTARRGWLMLFALSQVQLLARIFYYSVIEILLAFYDLIVGIFTRKNIYIEFKFLIPRIFSVVVCREIATLAAILDIYRGVGPIYLNHFAYDEHAHHRGPDSRFAFWALRGLDAAIRRVWKAAHNASRRGIRHYDVFVWSDHGQAVSTPFEDLFLDTPAHHFEALFRALYGSSHPSLQERRPQRTDPKGRRTGGPNLAPEHLARQAERAKFLTAVTPGWLSRLLHSLFRPAAQAEARAWHGEPVSPAEDAKSFKFSSTGPAAFICIMDGPATLTYEDWRERYPQFIDLIAQHKGVGFAITHTRAGGCMVGCNGRWFDLDDDRAMDETVTHGLAQILRSRREDLRRIANMKNAGDLVIYGQREPDQPVITYSYEHGSHGGPSPQETLPFILLPAPAAACWPEISPERSEPLLTLMDLHQRLRRTYNPQVVIDLSLGIRNGPKAAREAS